MMEAALERLDQTGITESGLSKQDVYRRLNEIIPTLRTTDESATAARVLAVYQAALEKLVAAQEFAFTPIKQYLASVNKFLEDKEVILREVEDLPSQFQVSVAFPNGRSEAFRVFSSGERQIVSLLFSATEMEDPRVVLVDEPELSLHVDWQRRLLQEMMDQFGDRQLIVCTHSPEIGAEFLDNFQEIQPVAMSSKRPAIRSK
jgi:predicted ATPase